MRSYSSFLFLVIVTLLVLSGAQVRQTPAQGLVVRLRQGVSGPVAVTWDTHPNEPALSNRSSSAGLIDLMSVEQLQSEFNRDHGSIRILVLMSPT
jgi:hypothetical protein